MITLKDPSLLKQQAYVNGQWIDALNGATNAVLNPATGEQIATVPDLGHQRTIQTIVNTNGYPCRAFQKICS